MWLGCSSGRKVLGRRGPTAESGSAQRAARAVCGKPPWSADWETGAQRARVSGSALRPRAPSVPRARRAKSKRPLEITALAPKVDTSRIRWTRRPDPPPTSPSVFQLWVALRKARRRVRWVSVFPATICWDRHDLTAQGTSGPHLYDKARLIF